MKGGVLTVVRVLLGLTISVALGWLVARGLDWSAVGETMAEFSPLLILVSLAVFMLASFIRALRWKLLFVDEPVSIARLFVVQNEGVGLNNLMPVRVAGEAAQLAVLTIRDGLRPATTLATLGMERVLDAVVSTAILGIAFFLVPEMNSFAPYVWAAFGISLVALAAVKFISWGSEGLPLIRRIRFLAAFAEAVRDLERERARLALSLLLSLIYWLLIGLTAWIAAQSVGLSITPTTATLVILGTIFFATAVPAAPAAIGLFEFAVVYTLHFFGVEREAGFGFAVVIHAVLFLPPTLIAVLFLPHEGVGSMFRLSGQVRTGEARGA